MLSVRHSRAGREPAGCSVYAIVGAERAYLIYIGEYNTRRCRGVALVGELLLVKTGVGFGFYLLTGDSEYFYLPPLIVNVVPAIAQPSRQALEHPSV